MSAKLIPVTMLIFFALASFGQSTEKNSYWVQFKNKKGTPFQISQPEKFLSQRAIDRRMRQHIAIDSTDLPVSPVYLDSLKAIGLEIFHTSKWLNGATVRTADSALINRLDTLGFISEVQFTKPAVVTKSAHLKFNESETAADINPEIYGQAIDQLTQLNGEYLHNSGFRGKGIQIAVLDGGFWHADQIAAFDSLYNSGRILGTRDFVEPASDVYLQHWHGMGVLSCMGGNLPDTMVGTAPDASFYLFRTEDISSEYIIEEDNWVAAAEYADSLGVDEINSSLGYFTFDDSLMNHTYADLNGNTTRVTRGANMAFRKGILVFTSAGNEGTDSWKHIIAPSDGEGVIGVAAVDKNGLRASFSSVGPAFGGAVKPNVAARGFATYLITSSGVPGTGSGTSFSSPVLAGMGACLLQANPYASVKQVKFAIEQSASQYNTPDSLLGYGIPDFERADKYLKVNSVPVLKSVSTWAVAPNPFFDHLVLTNPDRSAQSVCRIRIYDLQGVCWYKSTEYVSGTILLKNLSFLPDGLLILSVNSGGKKERLKVIKAAQ